MISDPENWREGARAYRNSIELAKEYRDNAIQPTNATARRTLVPTSLTSPNGAEASSEI